MKKYTVLCAALCTAMLFTGCKSKESAYKQAYLKAKQQDEMQQAQQQQAQQEQQYEVAPVVETPQANVVVPMDEKPANQTQVVDNGDNIKVRPEAVTVVNGNGLKNFSVIVGSFSLMANAEGLQKTLLGQGYADAQVVQNSNVSPVMYRVVATTFDSKTEAESSRLALTEKFPGAWLLYAK